ncbi:MAG: RidA family protein [Rhodopseudomonas sp.]|uniref:RidA family protein n=1 Tax=Rhodopseudomonas sp. TaxID=1078 RepID=UPI0017D597A7|nr:RidA family protein [Rhodopseudomonas sp.]NVN85489.1 RidA family protein [Rhodopseudomonas sp.]
MSIAKPNQQSVTPHEILQPPGWAKPIGYANGMRARGQTVFVGGQIGWNAQCKFVALDLAGQVRQALENVVAILHEGGAGPEHITTMTWYVTDRKRYVAELKQIGEAYRATIGRHFPAMAVVEVSGLIEDQALVEIQATAVVPD